MGCCTSDLRPPGQKKAVESLRKFDDLNAKSNKASVKGAKELTDRLVKVREAMTAIGVAALSLDGLRNFAIQTAQGNAALGRQAKLLGINVTQLAAFREAAKKLGGTDNSISGGLASIESKLARAPLNMGGEEIYTQLGQLRVQWKDGTVDLYKLADALRAFQDQYGTQKTLAIAGALGFDDAGYQLLVQGSAILHKTIDALAEKIRVDDDLAASSQKLTDAEADFQASLKGVYNEISKNVNPALVAMEKNVSGLVKAYAEFDSKTGSITSEVAMGAGVAASGAGAVKLMRMFAMRSPAAAEAAAVAAEAVGVAGAGVALPAVAGVAGLAAATGVMAWGLNRLFSNPKDGEVDPSTGKVWKSNGGRSGRWIDNPNPAGMHQVRSGRGGASTKWVLNAPVASSAADGSSGGLPRNLRNNNPGNIEFGDFAKKHGATGSDGRFAVFPSMAAGQAAMHGLMDLKYGSGLTSIAKLIGGSGGVKGWLGSGADLKDAASYISDVSKKSGIAPNAILSQSDMLRVQGAMSDHEGMIGARQTAYRGGGGGNTSEVFIQNQTINTAATDVNGIASGIGDAMARNAILRSSIVGSQ